MGPKSLAIRYALLCRPNRCGDENSGMTSSAETAAIKVFLLDDHESVRRGVRDLLEAEPDITVIGEAGTAQSALARIPALRPDVAGLGGRRPRGGRGRVCPLWPAFPRCAPTWRCSMCGCPTVTA